MDPTEDNYHPSRPVRPPRRLALPLRGGGQTSVFVHDPPAGTSPRLPVLYVHGIQSHPGWFAGSASAMAEAGHPVFQVTRRGSGDSDARRGDAKNVLQLWDDVTDAARFITQQTSQSRMHLVGVSWGGKLLAPYVAMKAVQHGIDVASLTLIAPGIFSQVDVAPMVKLQIGLCTLLWPTKRFMIPLSDVELFTENPLMQQYLRDDPLRLHHATARFLVISRQLDQVFASMASPGCVEVPTRLILADHDRIIDNEKTAAMVQHLTGKRAEIVTLHGAHTLEFEVDPSAFFEAIVSGLEE